MLLLLSGFWQYLLNEDSNIWRDCRFEPPAYGVVYISINNNN